MKEIGGYFQLDQFISHPYHTDMVELNTARNALIYLIDTKKIQKVFLPYFLCDSVSNILRKHSIAFEYYHIDNNFLPVKKNKMKQHEYMYIVNYYGQLSNERLLSLQGQYENIIVDNVQAFFQEPINEVDTIYSCRKFFGLPDGAYLSTNSLMKDQLDDDQSSDRMIHILGRYEGKASDYYEYFQKNDKSFKELPLKRMSKLTRNILGAIDYNRTIQARNRNYKYLQVEFGPANQLDLTTPEGPYAYPYYVENGREIRKKLAQRSIYIPTLWPNVLKENTEDSLEYNFAENILPLPCDQRYDLEDMDRLIKEFQNV